MKKKRTIPHPGQGDLFAWADCRPTATIIDAIPAIALRVWLRRQWPKPQRPCTSAITINGWKKSA